MGQPLTIGSGRSDDATPARAAGRRAPGVSTATGDGGASLGGGAGVLDEVRRIIELIRPAVQSDGGDLELVEVTADGVVRVRFHGACVGCPSSTLTLQSGIERSLRDRVEGVVRVEAVP